MADRPYFVTVLLVLGFYVSLVVGASSAGGIGRDWVGYSLNLEADQAMNREPTTCALVFRELCDLICFWGARWARQAFWFLGLGIGFGATLAWIAKQSLCH